MTLNHTEMCLLGVLLALLPCRGFNSQIPDFVSNVHFLELLSTVLKFGNKQQIRNTAVYP